MFVFNYSLSQELAIGIPCAGADPSSDLKKNRILIRAFFLYFFVIRYPDHYQELL